MKKILQPVGYILITLLSPVTLLAGIFLFGWVIGNIRDARIEKDVSAYVLENKDMLELLHPRNGELIIRNSTGTVSAGVDYGYYYSVDDQYEVYTGTNNQYRNGYREFGYPDDPSDWFYSSKICDHWYYFEIHDG